MCSVPYAQEYYHLPDLVEAVSQAWVYYSGLCNLMTLTLVEIDVSICRLIPKIYVTFET